MPTSADHIYEERSSLPYLIDHSACINEERPVQNTRQYQLQSQQINRYTTKLLRTYLDSVPKIVRVLHLFVVRCTALLLVPISSLSRPRGVQNAIRLLAYREQSVNLIVHKQMHLVEYYIVFVCRSVNLSVLLIKGLQLRQS
jgi:hypothetical protein